MKNILFASLLMIFFAQSSWAQSINNTNKLTDDEVARVKFSVHLINYQNPPAFDNASGEAYYNVVNASFSQSLTIPSFTITGLTDHDKEIVNQRIELLSGSMANPLSWEHLWQLEAQYLSWVDKAIHKVSAYKN